MFRDLLENDQVEIQHMFKIQSNLGCTNLSHTILSRDVNVTSKKVTVTVTRYFGKKSNRYSYSLHFQNE